MMLRKLMAGVVVLAVGTVSLYAQVAFAGDTIVLLVRSTLSNNNDADGGGVTQNEGGVVQNAAGTVNIGHYIVTRRVTNSGTEADNTASEIITLFFPSATAGNVPNNITLQGAYSYNTGMFAGSVSATSTNYHPLNGAEASGTISGTTTKLAISYIGSERVP